MATSLIFLFFNTKKYHFSSSLDPYVFFGLKKKMQAASQKQVDGDINR